MAGPLYAILNVPHAHGLPPAAVAQAMLRGGAGWVQLRAKRADTAERTALLIELAPIFAEADARLVVNDDVEAALDPRATVDALHLGQGDPGVDNLPAIRRRAEQAGRHLRIGISTHDLAQLRAADAQAPDYVAFGPVAATPSKVGHDPVVGIAGLADACRIARSPVVAIGGLDQALATRAIEVGAAMAAVIGALCAPTAAEVEDRTRDFARRLIDASRPLSISEVHARIPVISCAALEQIARFGDDLSVHIGMGLPARFRPICEQGEIRYRPCDVEDLLGALGKRGDESWEQWLARGDLADDTALVRLRRRD